jgi:hypothetical protein
VRKNGRASREKQVPRFARNDRQKGNGSGNAGVSPLPLRLRSGSGRDDYGWWLEEKHASGLKPASGSAMRPEAEASGYLEAKA